MEMPWSTMKKPSTKNDETAIEGERVTRGPVWRGLKVTNPKYLLSDPSDPNSRYPNPDFDPTIPNPMEEAIAWLNEEKSPRNADSPNEDIADPGATEDLKVYLWQQLSEVARHARLVAIDDPVFGTLAHVLGIATVALQNGKLELLNQLRPELEKLHARFQAELHPESLTVKLDGPERSDRVKRMDAAAQRWMDAGALDAADGVRWVAMEALGLFEGETKANLEDLSLDYEPFQMDNGETVNPEAPDLVKETAAQWGRKRKAESHEYVSVVLRAAGVSSKEVNEMFTYKRQSKARSAKQRSKHK
jgi:hypothetical protein